MRWLALSLFFGSAMALSAAPVPVILISVDTLRADHLGAYGYRGIATPHMDALARGGTLFANIACQTPLTLPSHTSLLTSTYPFENGIQENAERVPSGIVTLAGVLKSHGYRTAAFIGSVFLEEQMGLNQGFDTYDSPFNFEAFSPRSGEVFFGGVENRYAVRDRRDGAMVIAAALRWLSANRDQPVFVFIHLFDLHTPYSIPERRGISRYDAQLEFVDGLVGRLTAGLKRSGWWDRSVTMLISDHGEGLGDHGETSHGYFIYQSTLHVPLVFHWPTGTERQPMIVQQPGGLIDVAPTLLDFLQLPIPTSFHGSTLLGGAPHAVYSESLNTHDSFGWAPLRSIREGGYKYIDAPHPELYHVEQDPDEKANLILSEPARTRALRAELAHLLTAYSIRKPAQESTTPLQTEKLLMSLGYVSRGPHARNSSAPDPKDRLPEYRLYEQSMDAITNQRLDEAVALLQKVLAEDPTNWLARRDLATCYLDEHQYKKARMNFEPLAAAAPGDYGSQLGLGLADKHLGLIGEARVHVEAACRIAPRAEQCHRELDSLRQGTK